MHVKGVSLVNGRGMIFSAGIIFFGISNKDHKIYETSRYHEELTSKQKGRCGKNAPDIKDFFFLFCKKGSMPKATMKAFHKSYASLGCLSNKKEENSFYK